LADYGFGALPKYGSMAARAKGAMHTNTHTHTQAHTHTHTHTSTHTVSDGTVGFLIMFLISRSRPVESFRQSPRLPIIITIVPSC